MPIKDRAFFEEEYEKEQIPFHQPEEGFYGGRPIEGTEAYRIAQGNPVRSFTDDPGLLGSVNEEAATEQGVSKWESVPAGFGKKEGELSYASDRPEKPKKEVARSRPSTVPGPGATDADGKYPNNVFGFTQRIIDMKWKGEHPAEMNKSDMATEALERNESKVFEELFLGEYSYSAEQYLPPEAKKLWNAAKAKKLGDYEEQAEEVIKQRKDYLKGAAGHYEKIQGMKVKARPILTDRLKNIYNPDDPNLTLPAKAASEAMVEVERLIDSGKSAPEAIDIVVAGVLRKRTEDLNKSEALSAIPKPGVYTSSADKRKGKEAFDNMVNLDIPPDEIKSRFKEQGWKDSDIKGFGEAESTKTEPSMFIDGPEGKKVNSAWAKWSKDQGNTADETKELIRGDPSQRGKEVKNADGSESSGKEGQVKPKPKAKSSKAAALKMFLKPSTMAKQRRFKKGLSKMTITVEQGRDVKAKPIRKKPVVVTQKIKERPKEVSVSDETRADGSQKGPGFLGTLQRPDGKVSTEISIGVNMDGRETEIPSLVPTLTQGEIDHLLGGGEMTDAIVKKAVAHARKRISVGKSPFKEIDQKKDRKRPVVIRKKIKGKPMQPVAVTGVRG